MDGNAPATPPPPPPPKDYFLGFNFAIDRQSAANLVALAQQAVAMRAKSVTICICSNGGAPDQALYAYEILSALPIPIHTHAIGSVQSAAMNLFMCGNRRTAAPGTTFLFHETVWNGVGASLRIDDLLGQTQAINQNDKWSHQLVAQRLSRPPKEVAKWFRGQQIRDTNFALKNGIIQSVQSLVVPPAAEFVQVAYKF
jgi:ATP-dependent protease ClpP protease subunit